MHFLSNLVMVAGFINFSNYLKKNWQFNTFYIEYKAHLDFFSKKNLISVENRIYFLEMKKY